MPDAMQDEAVSHTRAGTFDNRGLPVRDRLRLQIQRTRHFRVRAGDTEFVYCHIPKNACTAFKRLVMAHSEYRAHAPAYKRQLKFMKKYHAVRRPSRAARYEHIVFVYRDPIERAVSAFRNKFIMRWGPTDLFDSYRKVTGRDPEQATFDAYVDAYLSADMNRVDPHCRTQSDFLFPVKYSHAIPMSALHTEMARLLGAETADAYFKSKRNTSGDIEYSDTLHDVSASELCRRWQATGEMPSRDSFLTDRTRAALERIYARDIAMLADIERG